MRFNLWYEIVFGIQAASGSMVGEAVYAYRHVLVLISVSELINHGSTIVKSSVAFGTTGCLLLKKTN